MGALSPAMDLFQTDSGIEECSPRRSQTLSLSAITLLIRASATFHFHAMYIIPIFRLEFCLGIATGRITYKCMVCSSDNRPWKMLSSIRGGVYGESQFPFSIKADHTSYAADTAEREHVLRHLHLSLCTNSLVDSYELYVQC